MSNYYILDGHTPVACDTLTWAEWFESNDRAVKQENVGPYWVSTVFLGLDHNHFGGRPLLFETMVFYREPPSDTTEDQERYCTWDEAERGHEAMVEKYRMILADMKHGTKKRKAIEE